MASIEVRNHKKEDAVSPVVGVMLMLVVTIVIAAVVAMFATGVFSETQPASVAVLECDADVVVDGNQITSMTFTHKGGDVLYTKDLTLQVTYNGTTNSALVDSIKKDSTKTTWSAGEKLVLSNSDDSAIIGTTLTSTVTYFTWSIKDGSGLVIAEGKLNNPLAASA